MTDSTIWKSITERFQKVIDDFDQMKGHTSVVIYPNDAKNRDSDYPWFEIFPLHSQPHQQELGATGRNRWTLGLQININYPSGYGTYAVDEVYDYIAKNFKRGDIFDGIRVLQSTYRSSARVYDDYYSVPVTVMVQADLEN